MKKKLRKIVAVAASAVLVLGGAMAVHAESLNQPDVQEETIPDAPEGLTMTFGGFAPDIELPDGFEWMDLTIYDQEEMFPESVGEMETRVLYRSESGTVYAHIPMTVTVLPKEMSGINLDDIGPDTDLDTYEIVAEDMCVELGLTAESDLVPMTEDIVLVKDHDYTISSVTEGNRVTVTVNFMGNYTGTAVTEYYLDNSPADDEDPVSPVPDAPGDTGNQEDSTSQALIDRIQGADEGSEITVNMDGTTVIPAEVLEAARGRNVDLVFDMGNYTWTINGLDISEENLKDTDLGVIYDAGQIPEAVVNTVSDGNPAIQFSLMHDGEFGFQATLTFNIGTQYSGKYANLFYYNNQTMEYVAGSQVDGKGNVTFRFSHASDYVMVISDTAMSQDSVVGGSQTTTGSGNSSVKTAPRTGDTSPIIPAAFTFGVASCVLAAGVMYQNKRIKQ